MQLATYLAEQKITTAEFAGKVGVTQAAVSRYANGQRIPRRAVLDRISAETAGRVTANDFFGEVDEPEAERAA